MGLGGTDLNLVIALKALLEEGNVTKAGAKIGKSQPAMSTALARLRRHYKDELLVRVGRDYELTPFARALIPSVQQTVSSVEYALDIGRRFDPRPPARVPAGRHRLRDHRPGRTLLRRSPSPRCGWIRPIPMDMHDRRGLMHCDALIAPLGFGFGIVRAAVQVRLRRRPGQPQAARRAA